MQRLAIRTGATSRRLLAFAAATVALSAARPRAVDAQGCAAPETIAADRPGFLTGPLVLAKGSLQLESGWTMSRVSGGTAQAVGSTLLRVPVGCVAELRIGAGGYMFNRTPAGVSTSGIADAYLGTKIHLVTGSHLRPNLSVFAGSSVPVGGAFSHLRAEPETDLSAAWDLPHGQALLAYGGIASRVAGDGRQAERISGATWSAPLSARVGTFVELVEFARRDVSTHYVTTGLTVFPHATLQIDSFLSVPLPRAGSDVAIGLGVSRRW